MKMKPVQQTKGLPKLPSPCKTNRAIIYTFALLIVHDVLLALTPSGGGAASIVNAYVYARPASSRSPCIDQKCSRCPGGKKHELLGHSRKLAYELRCGSMAQNNSLSPPRRSSSRLMTNSGSTIETKNNARYHLIWSENFWKKMLLSMTAWLIIQYALRNSNFLSMENILPSHEASCHARSATATPWGGFRRVFPSAIALPLLSSSCCAIQLLINALSGWGCAGFNTYLGPIRPALLPILLISTWKLLPHRSIGWSIISLFLAFLPELVDIWNMYRSQQWKHGKFSGNNGNMEETSSASLSLPVKANLRLDIPTMGCVACVNKVDASIRQCKSAANVRDEISWLTDGAAKGGVAELTILGRTREEIDGIANDVVSSLKTAGFQCNVESLQVE